MKPLSFLQRIVQVLARRDGARKTVMLCHALLSERGEASGAALARETLASLQGLDDRERTAFFDALVADFSPDPEFVAQASQAYLAAPTQSHLIGLQRAVEPPRQELFRRLNMAPGGTAALVEIRRRMLADLKAKPEWAGIDADLGHLLASWFNRGFLVLQRIDWRTPALVLEKLIEYEAVHEIEGWSDLRRRLQADRRCFAFFHPALPDEPLIFIEVALTRGMSERVRPLLDHDRPVSDPADADTAIFYSITNCQDGLRGISFGNFLIKQVVAELSRELPRLKTFATLSPIPGFRAWLKDSAADLAGTPGAAPYLEMLERLKRPTWYKHKAIADSMRPRLLALCAYYLLHAKLALGPLDPVARFHLGNGARLERLNWLADDSRHGIEQSAGMMANYLYRLAEVERNHEAFASEHRIVASGQLDRLARECPLHPSHAEAQR